MALLWYGAARETILELAKYVGPCKENDAHMTLHEESLGLHQRARAFVDAFVRGAPTPEPFDTLGCDLARFQARFSAGYGRLCAARNVQIARISSASEAPAVPTDAFKVTRVSVWPETDERTVFRTSGTSAGARGAHWFHTTETYDAGAIAFGRAMLLPDIEERVPVFVLGPPPEELLDSSLGHMIARFVEAFGTPATLEQTYCLRDGVFDLPTLDERVARLIVHNQRGALVLGTAFAYVHFLDALGDAKFRMPEGTRVMQTGGFKGKSREVDAETLRRDVARALCVAPDHVVGEYGMTELSSQFYEATLRGGERGVYVEPPWARVVPVDPETLAPVPDGEIGIARVEDLLNVDSAFAVVTADRVRRKGAGFELLGRQQGAPPRGCSIAIDELVGGAG